MCTPGIKSIKNEFVLELEMIAPQMSADQSEGERAGDDVVKSKTPCIQQLISRFAQERWRGLAI